MTMDLSHPFEPPPPATKTDGGGDDDDVSNEHAMAKKKAKRAPLHEDYSAPLSFLEDAVKAAQSGSSFNLTKVGEAFGNLKEAYARPCYEHVAKKIADILYANTSDKRKLLFVLRGSSGVGKSTFLAYGLVRLGKYFGNGKIILCHAGKSLKGDNISDNTECQVWDKQGTVILSGLFKTVQNELNNHLPSTGLIIMDGCSLPLLLERYKGTILMASSPSLYIKNIEDAIIISRRKYYTIPSLIEREALDIASLIGVDHEVVKQNLAHMGGITRYLFEPDIAKQKVQEAVRAVDASSITKMVSMQVSNKATEQYMVHALVLWKVNVENGEGYEDNPRFELASRYAERLVAEKLAVESAETLKAARRSLAPLSGAEGYAGALFEAYAIRTLLTGGTFTARNLSDGTTFVLEIPEMSAPVVIETNEVTTSSAPANAVRVAVGEKFVPKLLWPTTTNFPTFDCFYFHTDGKVYSLQMTIAKKHGLKNSGALNAKAYFDKLLRSEKHQIYPAVFVVPTEMEAKYKPQRFTGDVDKAAPDMSKIFNQFVIGL